MKIDVSKDELVPLAILSQHEDLDKLIMKHHERAGNEIIEIRELLDKHEKSAEESWFNIESELLDKGIIKERGLHLRIENDIIYQVKGE